MNIGTWQITDGKVLPQIGRSEDGDMGSNVSEGSVDLVASVQVCHHFPMQSYAEIAARQGLLRGQKGNAAAAFPN